MSARALYLHLPFCRRRCNYCDFVTHQIEGFNAETQKAYCQALLTEIGLRGGADNLTSIYLGGGTPTALPPALLCGLLAALRPLAAPAAEITVEANPCTLDYDYLQALRRAGVNRLSLGVQSFDDTKLEQMGRLHTAEQARQAFTAARAAGFDNISLDLIYALPAQNADDLQYDIKQALALKPEHISLYGLTLSPNSPWGRQFKAGELALPDDEQSAALQELIFSKLKRAGYEHYEIANFALDGTKKSRHNCAYWHREDYLGAGAGAAGALGDYRYTNKGEVAAYLEALRQGKLPPAEDERLSAEQVRAEALILALRLAEGADLFALSSRYNFDFLSAYGANLRELAAIGLLDEREGLFALTGKGILLANEVFVRLI